MKSASEMKILSEKCLMSNCRALLVAIENKINDAAYDGRFSVTVRTSGFKGIREAVTILESKGYKCTQGMQYNESYLTIEWGGESTGGAALQYGGG